MFFFYVFFFFFFNLTASQSIHKISILCYDNIWLYYQVTIQKEPWMSTKEYSIMVMVKDC